MQALEIEKEVPTPKERVVYKYPYDDMQIGDSFTVPVSHKANVMNANHRAGKRLARRFMARTEGDYVRVWRIR
jgi:hypothetical protein